MQKNTNDTTREKVLTLVYAGSCMALCLILPFFTGQIPQVGAALSPMHIPALLTGFLCGPWWGLAVGFISPLLRMTIFGMPPFLTAVRMSFELAAYAFVAGLLFQKLPKKRISIYIALIAAMIIGRVIWGIVSVLILGISGQSFTWTAFITGAVLSAVPGIVLQIILVPVIVMALTKQK